MHNSYLLKSPVNVVLTAFRPERLFVERLLEPGNAGALKAWVKSPDVGFYSIEYGYQPGGNGRSKRGSFNPDYFLLREGSDEVVVVEVKDNDDVTDQNRGKLAYAEDYFATLNQLLDDAGDSRRYSFHFLSPVDYDDFFEGLRKGETRWVRLDASRRVERNAGRRLTRDRGRGTLEGLRASADTRRTEAPPPLTGAQESKNRAAHMVREVGRFHADRRSARLGLHVSPNQPCWERPVRRNWAHLACRTHSPTPAVSPSSARCRGYAQQSPPRRRRWPCDDREDVVAFTVGTTFAGIFAGDTPKKPTGDAGDLLTGGSWLSRPRSRIARLQPRTGHLRARRPSSLARVAVIPASH